MRGDGICGNGGCCGDGDGITGEDIDGYSCNGECDTDAHVGDDDDADDAADDEDDCGDGGDYGDDAGDYY